MRDKITQLVFMVVMLTLSLSTHAQERGLHPTLWLSTGLAFDHLLQYDGMPVVERTDRMEYSLLSVGLQLKPWLRTYTTLEYATYSYETYLADYQLKRGGNYTTDASQVVDQGVLIEEIEENKQQEVLFPSLWVEAAIPVYKGFHIGVAAGFGMHRRKHDYTYTGSWGYGGNGVDAFDEIEVNTIGPTNGAYVSRRYSLRFVPEWRHKNFQVAPMIGLQYFRFGARQEFNGWTKTENGSYGIQERINPNKYYELSWMFGIRVSHLFNIDREGKLSKTPWQQAG